MAWKQDGVQFVLCPKQCNEMGGGGGGGAEFVFWVNCKQYIRVD